VVGGDLEVRRAHEVLVVAPRGEDVGLGDHRGQGVRGEESREHRDALATEVGAGGGDRGERRGGVRRVDRVPLEIDEGRGVGTHERRS
jgi:hypothetical protein